MSGSITLRGPTDIGGPWYASQTGEDSKLVYTGKGMLHSLYIVNANAAIRYAYVFDSLTAAGTQIAGPFPVAAGGFLSVFLQYGIQFTTGLTVALSSTLPTYTASGGTDGRFTVGWGFRK